MSTRQHRQLSEAKTIPSQSKKKTLVIAMPVYKNTPNPDGQFSPFVWLQAIYKTVQVRQKMSI
jgi:hypothetical protein